MLWLVPAASIQTCSTAQCRIHYPICVTVLLRQAAVHLPVRTTRATAKCGFAEEWTLLGVLLVQHRGRAEELHKLVLTLEAGVAHGGLLSRPVVEKFVPTTSFEGLVQR